jgi:hypothetical protein
MHLISMQKTATHPSDMLLISFDFERTKFIFLKKELLAKAVKEIAQVTMMMRITIFILNCLED